MIDSIVNTLNDYNRQVIELRYKYNKSEAQIGVIVYRTKRAINKTLKKAINELEMKYRKSS